MYTEEQVADNQQLLLTGPKAEPTPPEKPRLQIGDTWYTEEQLAAIQRQKLAVAGQFASADTHQLALVQQAQQSAYLQANAHYQQEAVVSQMQAQPQKILRQHDI